MAGMTDTDEDLGVEFYGFSITRKGKNRINK